ncbi:N alpha-acetyl-transferase [Cladophialophora chaetospira]|uniref:N-alpha-acetyltransferase 40 n=1 Tax=Cladophialophora chaetospira TaxID=386627 RepID=A0AA39CF94_9EURO|nr:N alpha-acetyl-transferase [Cladophialophora chaetospira]
MSSSKRPKRDEAPLKTLTSPSRAGMKEKLVEKANAMSANDFYDQYAPPNFKLELFKGAVKPPFHLSWVYGDAKLLLSAGDSLLRECMKLIEQTSAKDYQNSEMKWSTAKKWKEMQLPDMKYIILVTPEDVVAGFVSFMITYEDGLEVLYLYEIHLIPEWQTQGLGRNMLHVVECFARNVGVAKVMLTVFRANERAIEWYAKRGYQEDKFSPGPRKLRNGTIKQPSYTILSKQVKS